MTAVGSIRVRRVLERVGGDFFRLFYFNRSFLIIRVQVTLIFQNAFEQSVAVHIFDFVIIFKLPDQFIKIRCDVSEGFFRFGRFYHGKA